VNTNEIILQYLKDNGYDGLVNEERKCNCTIDNLFSCEDNVDDIGECVAGKFKDCKKCDSKDNDNKCVHGRDYCISSSIYF